MHLSSSAVKVEVNLKLVDVTLKIELSSAGAVEASECDADCIISHGFSLMSAPLVCPLTWAQQLDSLANVHLILKRSWWDQPWKVPQSGPLWLNPKGLRHPTWRNFLYEALSGITDPSQHHYLLTQNRVFQLANVSSVLDLNLDLLEHSKLHLQGAAGAFAGNTSLALQKAFVDQWLAAPASLLWR